MLAEASVTTSTTSRTFLIFCNIFSSALFSIFTDFNSTSLLSRTSQIDDVSCCDFHHEITEILGRKPRRVTLAITHDDHIFGLAVPGWLSLAARSTIRLLQGCNKPFEARQNVDLETKDKPRNLANLSTCAKLLPERRTAAHAWRLLARTPFTLCELQNFPSWPAGHFHFISTLVPHRVWWTVLANWQTWLTTLFRQTVAKGDQGSKQLLFLPQEWFLF